MKTYRVISQQATFGIGMVLKLSEQQSTVRQHALTTTKKKDMFIVKLPVHFKKGEVVTLVKDELSRFLSNCLTEVDASTETSTATTISKAEPNTVPTLKTANTAKADGI